MKKKCFYMGGTLLIGVIVCVSVFFLLRERKGNELQRQLPPTTVRHRNREASPNKNLPQQGKNPDARPIPIEKIIQQNKSQMMSILSEKQLANPEIQKRLALMDSPAYREFMKDAYATGLNQRKMNDFWESQGFRVKREYPEMFRHYFPTGEPEDYDQKMRLKIAEMFLTQEPVDLTDPLAAARQRLNVVSELIKDKTDAVWYLGRFGDEWDGPMQGVMGVEQGEERRNAATEWMIDIQRNAASIVEAAETAGVGQASAPSWDMSSVVESSSAPHSETEVSTTVDTSERDPMTGAEIERSLTRQPPDIPQNQKPDTPSELPSNLEASLKSQFSSERFDRAMSTLEQYGPEEGLRRLRQSDPDFAKQVEQHRNREEVSK